MWVIGLISLLNLECISAFPLHFTHVVYISERFDIKYKSGITVTWNTCLSHISRKVKVIRLTLLANTGIMEIIGLGVNTIYNFIVISFLYQLEHASWIYESNQTNNQGNSWIRENCDETMNSTITIYLYICCLPIYMEITCHLYHRDIYKLIYLPALWIEQKNVIFISLI